MEWLTPETRVPAVRKIGWLLATAASAAIAVGLVLWTDDNERERPDLSEEPVAVTVADHAMSIPRNVLRFAGQRRQRAHSRLDLALAWPTLTGRSQETATLFDALGRQPDIVWVAVTPKGDNIGSEERLASVYGRLFVGDPWSGPDGLQGRRLSAKAGYAGEEIYFEPGVVHPFVARCYAVDAGNSVDVCLHDEIVGPLLVQWRFGRERLDDWRMLSQRLRGRLAAWGLGSP